MRQRPQHRSIRVLAWTLFFAVAAQLAGGWYLDNLCLGAKFPQAYQHLSRLEKMLAQGESPTVIYFGSSRFNCGLHEALLTDELRKMTGDSQVRALQGSVSSGDLISADFLLEQFLARGAQPRLAIVELMPEYLNHRNLWLSGHIWRQFTWSDFPKYAAETYQVGQFRYWLQGRFAPLYVHRYHFWKYHLAGVAPRLLGPYESSWHHTLWTGDLPGAYTAVPELSPEARQRSEKMAKNTSKRMRDYLVGGTSLEALERLLRRCRANDIRVLFLRPPLTSAYRGAYTKEVLQQFEKVQDCLARAPGCHVVDCSSDVPDSLFFDHTHIGDVGRVQFTLRLCRDVLAPRRQSLFGIEPGQPVRQRPQPTH